MREIVHLQAGQCGNQIGGKVTLQNCLIVELVNEVRVIKMAIPRCRACFNVRQAVATDLLLSIIA